ncbi:MAG: hypothetical protein ACTHP8_07620 [Bosea sp. (in: a-proteobacteria)]|uniref:hypothetical protein n=1 Tax=Bosea sp. (in: a-proteobacteria) TaxID=1871050 RepID=UPI003F7C9B80
MQIVEALRDIERDQLQFAAIRAFADIQGLRPEDAAAPEGQGKARAVALAEVEAGARHRGEQIDRAAGEPGELDRAAPGRERVLRRSCGQHDAGSVAQRIAHVADLRAAPSRPRHAAA